MTCTYKRHIEEWCTVKREGHLKMEAESQALQPQTQECWQPPEVGEAKNKCPLELLKRAQPCQHIAFRLLDSTVVRKDIFVVFSYKFVVICSSSPSKLMQIFLSCPSFIWRLQIMSITLMVHSLHVRNGGHFFYILFFLESS